MRALVSQGICLHWARSCMAALTCLCLTVHTAIKIVSVLVSTFCPSLVSFTVLGVKPWLQLGKCSVTELWAQPSLPHSVSTLKARSCFHGRAMASFGGLSGRVMVHVACVLLEALRSHTCHRVTVLSQRLILDLRKKMPTWGQKKRSFYAQSRVAYVLLQSCPSLFLVWTISGHCQSLSTKSHTEWEASQSNRTTRPHEVWECAKK